MYILKTPDQNAEHGIDAEALEAFDKGELNPWQAVLLMQDVIEAGVLTILPDHYRRVCLYFYEIGFVHTNKRATH